MAAVFPRSTCTGTSTWKIFGGQWFPTGDLHFGEACVAALHFHDGPRLISVDWQHGLSDDDVAALIAKYPNDVRPVPDGQFEMPLVLPNTVVDITPEPSATA